jgi:hypothetical protein
MGKKGATPKRCAQNLRYEKSDLCVCAEFMDRFRANSMEAQLRPERKTRPFQDGSHFEGDFRPLTALIFASKMWFNLFAWEVESP